MATFFCQVNISARVFAFRTGKRFLAYRQTPELFVYFETLGLHLYVRVLLNQ